MALVTLITIQGTGSTENVLLVTRNMAASRAGFLCSVETKDTLQTLETRLIDHKGEEERTVPFLSSCHFPEDFK